MQGKPARGELSALTAPGNLLPLRRLLGLDLIVAVLRQQLLSLSRRKVQVGRGRQPVGWCSMRGGRVGRGRRQAGKGAKGQGGHTTCCGMSQPSTPSNWQAEVGRACLRRSEPRVAPRLGGADGGAAFVGSCPALRRGGRD